MVKFKFYTNVSKDSLIGLHLGKELVRDEDTTTQWAEKDFR